MVNPYLLLLLLVGIERLLELYISHKNAVWAFARGGVERGQGHWLPMRLLHTGLLLGALLEPIVWHRPHRPQLALAMTLVVLLAQALRYWAITSLRQCWNVRVIVVPGIQARCGGPYKYLRHPNYVAVVVEGIALPLVFNAWGTAVVFFVLNAWLLSVRIRTEQQALLELAQNYQAVGRGAQ